MYDADGNTLTDGVFDYVWDAENRLRSATPTAAAQNLGFTKRSEYRYDALGRRVEKRVLHAATFAVFSQTRTLYDGWDCERQKAERLKV